MSSSVHAGLGRTSDSVDYSAHCRQVRSLGGDCYEFLPLVNDRLALVVGDASGKGVAPALMIASVQSSLRTSHASQNKTAWGTSQRDHFCHRIAWRSPFRYE
jgi:serine phosphatase RsbU (regulator of sigma subunit)